MASITLRQLFSDHQEKKKRVIEARTKIAELVGETDVIEIGCGFGQNAEYIRGNYPGIDIDHGAIRIAAQRHPEKIFLCAEIESIANLFPKYQTVLFSAVLHEVSQFPLLLNTVMNAGIPRIFICDYDPELKGWLKIWMNIFEKDAKNWWQSKPATYFLDSEWSVQKGNITKALVWWDFRKE